MLNLVWVRSFLALAESGRFQLAARQLRIAQPTASLHLQKLEQRLGVSLLRRARGGCELTAAGRAFLPHAQSLLCVHDRALAAGAGRGTLRVGASSNIGIYLLQPYLRSFLGAQARGSAESSGFEVLIDRNPAIAEKLGNGEIDIAVMEWWQPQSGFTSRCWRSEPLVLIVPPHHALVGRAHVGKDELLGYELLGGEPGTGTGRLLDAYFAGSPQLPRIGLQLGSTEAVKQAVKSGLGISLVLASAVVDEVRSGSLHAIGLSEPPLCKDLHVIWRDTDGRGADEHGRAHASPPMPRFVRHLFSQPRSAALVRA